MRTLTVIEEIVENMGSRGAANFSEEQIKALPNVPELVAALKATVDELLQQDASLRKDEASLLGTDPISTICSDGFKDIRKMLCHIEKTRQENLALVAFFSEQKAALCSPIAAVKEKACEALLLELATTLNNHNTVRAINRLDGNEVKLGRSSWLVHGPSRNYYGLRFCLLRPLIPKQKQSQTNQVELSR